MAPCETPAMWRPCASNLREPRATLSLSLAGVLPSKEASRCVLVFEGSRVGPFLWSPQPTERKVRPFLFCEAQSASFWLPTQNSSASPAKKDTLPPSTPPPKKNKKEYTNKKSKGEKTRLCQQGEAPQGESSGPRAPRETRAGSGGSGGSGSGGIAPWARRCARGAPPPPPR